MDKEEYVTVNTFVNDEYRTHSQYTELYMTQEGLDFFKFNPGMKIKQAAEAARKYEQRKGSFSNV